MPARGGPVELPQKPTSRGSRAAIRNGVSTCRRTAGFTARVGCHGRSFRVGRLGLELDRCIAARVGDWFFRAHPAAGGRSMDALEFRAAGDGHWVVGASTRRNSRSHRTPPLKPCVCSSGSSPCHPVDSPGQDDSRGLGHSSMSSVASRGGARIGAASNCDPFCCTSWPTSSVATRWLNCWRRSRVLCTGSIPWCGSPPGVLAWNVNERATIWFWPAACGRPPTRDICSKSSRALARPLDAILRAGDGPQVVARRPPRRRAQRKPQSSRRVAGPRGNRPGRRRRYRRADRDAPCGG